MSMAMSVGSCATPVQTNLPGYTPGADIISVSPTRNQVDLIGDVVYSQIKELVLSDSFTCQFLSREQMI